MFIPFIICVDQDKLSQPIIQQLDPNNWCINTVCVPRVATLSLLEIIERVMVEK